MESRNRRLIICADDLGLSHGVNQAIAQAFALGRISVAGIMTNGNAFDEAAEFVKSSGIPCGVHLTLASECDLAPMKPLLPGTPADQDGHLFPNVHPYLDLADENTVYSELCVQIERALDFGLKPTHIDSHMHVFREDLLKRLSCDYGLPCRDIGELHQGAECSVFHLTVSGDTVVQKVIALTNYLDTFSSRLGIVICHPSANREEMQTLVSRRVPERYFWMTELRFQDIPALLSEEAGAAIDRNRDILTHEMDLLYALY